jgi:hypothetical protein
MPGKTEQSFGLHLLDNGFPFQVLIARIGDVAPCDRTGYKRAVEFHTKPLAKLPGVRESAAYPGDWRLSATRFSIRLSITCNL